MVAGPIRKICIIALIGGVTGLALVAAAPLGVVRPYPVPPNSAVDGPLGTSAPIDHVRELRRQPGEGEGTYFRRLTVTVANGITHWWSEADTWAPSDAPYTAVSPWDSWPLWLQSMLPAYQHLRDYEFVSPAKAIARGYGFCSQVSLIVHEVLRRQGIASTILTTQNHVVVEANGQILDADFGVYIPHTVAWMNAHPDGVDTYYADFPSSLPMLHQAYGDNWKPLGQEATLDYMRGYEAKMDVVKWIPPALLVALGMIGLAVPMRRRRSGSPGSFNLTGQS